MHAGIERVLSYFLHALNNGLSFKGKVTSDVVIEVYKDSAFATDQDREASTAYVVLVNEC